MVTGQVATWCENGIHQRRGQLVSEGQRVCEDVDLHMRQLGGSAASGARQVLFCSPDLQTAELGMQTCWGWWVYVDERVDARGYRMCGVRWFQDR